jgi:protein CpxP
MLKKLNLSLVVMLIFGLFAVNSYAQTSDRTKTKKTPEQKAEKMAKKMQEKLSLSDDQYRQVYDLALSTVNQRASLKSNGSDKETRKAEMKSLLEKQQLQLKTILSSDQWTKWETLKSEMKNKHKDGKHKKDKSKKKDKQLK